jgi:hypothetical protein
MPLSKARINSAAILSTTVVLGQTEMRVRVVNYEYRFTVESQSNDRWEMQQLIREAPLIAQWAQRTYGGAPIEVIVKR